MTISRINWSTPDDDMSPQTGRVGDLNLFTIECQGTGSFVLRSSMFAGKPVETSSRDAAQETAEKFLRFFVRRIGAMWKDEK